MEPSFEKKKTKEVSLDLPLLFRAHACRINLDLSIDSH